MRSRFTTVYFLVWFVVAVLLFFCFFGPRDREGFVVGWLFATRPGWLWFSGAAYVILAGALWIPYIAIRIYRED